MTIAQRGGKLAATALVLTCFAGVGVAEAAQSITKVTISNDNDTFSGSVSSKKDKCEPDRKVTLFKKTGDGKKKVGSDTTNDDGDWSVDSEKTGKFFAVVKETKSCFAAQSKQIKVTADDDDD